MRDFPSVHVAAVASDDQRHDGEHPSRPVTLTDDSDRKFKQRPQFLGWGSPYASRPLSGDDEGGFGGVLALRFGRVEVVTTRSVGSKSCRRRSAGRRSRGADRCGCWPFRRLWRGILPAAPARGDCQNQRRHPPCPHGPSLRRGVRAGLGYRLGVPAANDRRPENVQGQAADQQRGQSDRRWVGVPEVRRNTVQSQAWQGREADRRDHHRGRSLGRSEALGEVRDVRHRVPAWLGRWGNAVAGLGYRVPVHPSDGAPTCAFAFRRSLLGR